MPAPRPRRGPKPALTRAAVIEAALDLIDAEGLPALNLRKLATRLGVSAMTPYSYFSDKADLLDAMAGHALEPLRADPDSDAPWDQQVESAMTGMHHALARHPGAVELIMAQSDTQLLDVFRQRLIAMLERAGLSRDQSADTLRSLTSYILGYAILTRLRPRPPGRSRVDSFDHGLRMMMDTLRRDVSAAKATTSR
jgi:AcrR family transcriptional regulator